MKISEILVIIPNIFTANFLISLFELTNNFTEIVVIYVSCV